MRFFKKKKKKQPEPIFDKGSRYAGASKTTQAAIKKWVTEYEDDDTKYAEKLKTLQAFNKKFKLYIIFSVLYGLVFINYIDNIISGSLYGGYHMWLTLMYFFPFIALTISFPRNWQLTVGLGLLASLMNDVFYGLARSLMGYPIDLNRYYQLWLIPSGTPLFRLNLGIVDIRVYSWLMSLSIYARIPLIILLLWIWKRQAKIRYLKLPRQDKKRLLTKWWQIKNQRRTKAAT